MLNKITEATKRLQRLIIDVWIDSKFTSAAPTPAHSDCGKGNEANSIQHRGEKQPWPFV